ncbi:hypothetical protein BGX38DRAFT_1199479 [Terfezia claveryi]|nr:hypothetical protein BGX38DRAFT_1199479 [Terfezia claveryi]
MSSSASTSSTPSSPFTTPEGQLQFELAQHQQHLAHIQATQAAEIAQLTASQVTSNPVKAQANLDLQRQLLQQKLAEKSVLSLVDPNGPPTKRELPCLASPTDSMMSPCSKKLQQQKQRVFGKPKPRLLAKAFTKAAEEKEKENKQSSTYSSSLFGAAKTPIPKDEPIF